MVCTRKTPPRRRPMPRDTQSFAAAAEKYLQSDQFKQDLGTKYCETLSFLIAAVLLSLCVIGIPFAIALLIWKWPLMQRSRRHKAEWQSPGAVPIRLYPVMMNAEFLRGDNSSGPGMAIGSFDDDPALGAAVMMQLAQTLHMIYKNGPPSAAEQPLCDML